MVTAFEWHVARSGRVGCGMEAQARSLSWGLKGCRASRRKSPALEEAMMKMMASSHKGGCELWLAGCKVRIARSKAVRG